jgi:hypothetical protein
MLETELYWLAGLLEGEGYFTANRSNGGKYLYPKIELCMTDEDVVRKAHKVTGVGNVGGPYPDKRQPHWKPTWRWSVYGQKAFTLMDTLYPLLGARRQAKIDEIRQRMEAYCGSTPQAGV